MRGHRRILAGALGAALAIAAPPRSAAAQQPAAVVATVKTLTGAAFIVDGATGARTPAVVGTHLHAGDRLVTGNDGAMGVTFADDTVLSLGSASEIAVERFAYDPAADDYGFAARIARGTFLFATGKIAKYAPGKVAVTTPTGTLGIRGTRFLVKVEGR